MSNQINVYSQTGCMPCMATKRWLTKHDISFNDLDAKQHLDLLAGQLGYKTTPVVTITDGEQIINHWSGYRPEKLASIPTNPPTPTTQPNNNPEREPAL